VLVDIAKKLACGKVLDLLDASPLTGSEKSIIGTNDYSAIENSDIVVITAGLPRKPGMTRESLTSKNAVIVKDVAGKIKIHAPEAIVIVVTNPLDTMTYLTHKTTGFDKSRVCGMAGILDGARFATLIAEELKVRRSSVQTCVMGSHGDTMVPIISKTFVKGKPLTELLSKDKIDSMVKRTCDRGAEIISLLGTGSAYYSPSAAVMKMITAIMDDVGEVLPVSAFLNGEYGLKDIYMGVPCRLDRRGIVEVVEIDMSKEERASFLRSAKAVKSSIELL